MRAGAGVRGIAFMVGATVLFATMNALVKLLARDLPTVELVWARSLGHLVFVVALFAPRHGGWRLFRTRRPAIQLTRSLLLLTSTCLFFTAIGHVPLADATSVSFLAPLLVAVLAGPALGERVRRATWLAVGAGLVGMLLVVRPTAAGTHPLLLLVFGSASCYAVYQILTRLVAGHDSPETSVSYSALVGTAVLSAIVPFVWHAPAHGWHWLVLASLGVLGGLGHYGVARALALGTVSLISPFHYVQLVWAALAGWAVFGDVPGLATLAGAAIIIASGLFLALQEAGRAPTAFPRARTEAPPR